MGIYFDKEGNRYTQGQIDKRIRDAKAAKLDAMREEHGYVFCENCGINEAAGVPLDCSHNIGVQAAKNKRRVDLAWDVKNITIRCRKCHQAHDGLGTFGEKKK